MQISEFFVPIAAKVGEDQQLSCRYQLGNSETLYFLRWYKDGNEFFRYMPKETPPQRFYNVSGTSGIRVKVNFVFVSNIFINQSNRLYVYFKYSKHFLKIDTKVSKSIHSTQPSRGVASPAGGFTY